MGLSSSISLQQYRLPSQFKSTPNNHNLYQSTIDRSYLIKHQFNVSYHHNLIEEYNVTIFRKCNSEYVLAPKYFNAGQSYGCDLSHRINYFMEIIDYRLSDITTFCSISEAIHVLIQIIQGFSILIRKYGYFLVNADMIFFCNGKVKVWLNQNILENKLKENCKDINERQFIQQIVRLIDDRINEDKVNLVMNRAFERKIKNRGYIKCLIQDNVKGKIEIDPVLRYLISSVNEIQQQEQQCDRKMQMPLNKNLKKYSSLCSRNFSEYQYQSFFPFDKDYQNGLKKKSRNNLIKRNKQMKYLFNESINNKENIIKNFSSTYQTTNNSFIRKDNPYLTHHNSFIKKDTILPYLTNENSSINQQSIQSMLTPNASVFQSKPKNNIYHNENDHLIFNYQQKLQKQHNRNTIKMENSKSQKSQIHSNTLNTPIRLDANPTNRISINTKMIAQKSPINRNTEQPKNKRSNKTSLKVLQEFKRQMQSNRDEKSVCLISQKPSQNSSSQKLSLESMKYIINDNSDIRKTLPYQKKPLKQIYNNESDNIQSQILINQSKINAYIEGRLINNSVFQQNRLSFQLNQDNKMLMSPKGYATINKTIQQQSQSQREEESILKQKNKNQYSHKIITLPRQSFKKQERSINHSQNNIIENNSQEKVIIFREKDFNNYLNSGENKAIFKGFIGKLTTIKSIPFSQNSEKSYLDEAYYLTN